MIIFWLLNLIKGICWILFRFFFWGGISETGARLPRFCLICALRGFLQRSVSIILNTRRIWTQANVLIHTYRGLVSLCTRGGPQSKCLLSFNFGIMSSKNTVCIYSANCFKPSTCVVSKPVQVMSAVRELWSHVDLCKCRHSINNAVMSCVNYSIQGYANAHSAAQVRSRYS